MKTIGQEWSNTFINLLCLFGYFLMERTVKALSNVALELHSLLLCDNFLKKERKKERSCCSSITMGKGIASLLKMYALIRQTVLQRDKDILMMFCSGFCFSFYSILGSSSCLKAGLKTISSTRLNPTFDTKCSSHPQMSMQEQLLVSIRCHGQIEVLGSLMVWHVVSALILSRGPLGTFWPSVQG